LVPERAEVPFTASWEVLLAGNADLKTPVVPDEGSVLLALVKPD